MTGPIRPAARKPGEWNTFEITCKGYHLTVVLNGETVVDADPGEAPVLARRPRKGLVGLQSFAGRAEFRNLFIREFEPDRTVAGPLQPLWESGEAHAPGKPFRAALAPDGSALVSGGNDRKLQI